jgi:hypothetical protein
MSITGPPPINDVPPAHDSFILGAQNADQAG